MPSNALNPLGSIKDPAELTALLEKAKAAWDAMSPLERAEVELRQRVSWVRGEMGLTHPDMTKEELDALLRRTLPEILLLEEIDRLRAALKQSKAT